MRANVTSKAEIGVHPYQKIVYTVKPIEIYKVVIIYCLNDKSNLQ